MDVDFNDFIKDDLIPEDDGQVTSGSASLLEALGEYKCDTGMSVENVPAIVNIKTLKERFVATAHLFSTGWVVGVVKNVEIEKESVTKSKHC